MVLISACLLGDNVKYSGGNNSCQLLKDYQTKINFISICPECLGQLPVPRPPAEIISGDGQKVLNGEAKVTDNTGQDVTNNFISGAQLALKIAQEHNISFAILKSRSPSCGNGKIYDGNFNGSLITGDGITTALLKAHGIKVYSEEDITEELLVSLTK